MTPTMYSLLIMTLATGTIITMSSHHWLIAWLGLEINTLAMIPIITKPHHPCTTEAATKYFLVQAAAAALILLASTTNAWQTGHWMMTNTTPTITLTLMTIALTMKLGLAPAHFWYPEVIQGSTTTTALILSTWQKLAPLTLMYMTMHHLPPMILLTIGLLSSLIGGWAGINQTQLQKLMALSSIAHMGWLMVALTINHNLTTLTLVTYMTATTAMFTTLTMTTTKTLTDLNTAWAHSPMLLTMTMLTIMSLGGLPLTGFMPKWLITENLVYTTLTPLATALILSSLPNLFFYIRLTYFSTLTMPPNTTTNKLNWRFKPMTKQLLPPTLITSMLLLPTTSLIHATLWGL